jgi:hypothetical protein
MKSTSKRIAKYFAFLLSVALGLLTAGFVPEFAELPEAWPAGRVVN